MAGGGAGIIILILKVARRGAPSLLNYHRVFRVVNLLFRANGELIDQPLLVGSSTNSYVGHFSRAILLDINHSQYLGCTHHCGRLQCTCNVMSCMPVRGRVLQVLDCTPLHCPADTVAKAGRPGLEACMRGHPAQPSAPLHANAWHAFLLKLTQLSLSPLPAHRRTSFAGESSRHRAIEPQSTGPIVVFVPRHLLISSARLLISSARRRCCASTSPSRTMNKTSLPAVHQR